MRDEWWRLPVMLGRRLALAGRGSSYTDRPQIELRHSFSKPLPALSSGLRVVPCRPATPLPVRLLFHHLAANWSWKRSLLSYKCAQIEILLHQWGAPSRYAALFSSLSMKEMSQVPPPCNIQDFPNSLEKWPELAH